MFSGLDAIDVRHGRRWTALASFVLQGIVVSAAIVLPLLNPAILPDVKRRISMPISFGDPQTRPSETVVQRVGTAQQQPLFVRSGITYSSGHNQPTADGPEGPSLPPGASPIGDTQIPDLPSPNYAAPVLRQTPATKPPRISAMMEGNLIHRVEPQYPMIAKQIRIQGTVVVQAFVSADGRIERPRVLSGPDILARAALDAVKQWQYRPYYLNGQPIEVETQITVKFTLNQ